MRTQCNWRRIVFWVLLFTFWYVAPTEGQEPKPITLKVTPKTQIAQVGKRGVVRAAWRIEPNDLNVFYSLAYSGPEEGSTLRSMDEHSTIHYERIIELPPGSYIFQACVVRNERPKPKTYCASDNVEVQ